MYIMVTTFVGVSTPSRFHPVMTLSFYATRLSDLWTILGLALFSVSRPPSFLDQGTIIWCLTPGSEWLNGWFFAVSAVTSSVRGFVLLALPHSHTLLLTAIHRYFNSTFSFVSSLQTHILSSLTLTLHPRSFFSGHGVWCTLFLSSASPGCLFFQVHSQAQNKLHNTDQPTTHTHTHTHTHTSSPGPGTVLVLFLS